MKLEQRIERLEGGQGSPVRIAGWRDLSGVPFEPDAELRAFVEQEAYSLQPDCVEWRWAVKSPDQLVGTIIVLLSDSGRLQVIEVGTRDNPK